MGSDPKEKGDLLDVDAITEKDSHLNDLANPPVLKEQKESDLDVFHTRYITAKNHAEVLKQVFQTQPSAFESLLTTTTMTIYKKTSLLSCLADLLFVLKMTKWGGFHGEIKGSIQMLWTEINDGAPELCEWLQPLRNKIMEASSLTEKTGELKKKLQDVEDQLKKINVDSDSMMGLGFF
jgi:predicted transcriptional regulator